MWEEEYDQTCNELERVMEIPQKGQYSLLDRADMATELGIAGSLDGREVGLTEDVERSET